MGGQAPCALQVQLVIRLIIMLINIITTSIMTIIIGSREGGGPEITPSRKPAKNSQNKKQGKTHINYTHLNLQGTRDMPPPHRPRPLPPES